MFLKWSGTAGLIFQHAGACDEKGNPIIKDFYGSPLAASGKPYDDMLVAKFECVYTGSGDQGSSMVSICTLWLFITFDMDGPNFCLQFAFNMEQGIPVMPEWLFFNRVNARARKVVEIGPTRLLLRDAWDMAAEICLSQLPSLVEDRMIVGAATSTEKYLCRSGVGQSRSSAGIKLTSKQYACS
ncbi:hypothetical protein GOBAR_AA17914 [Gossypium barbadense]|uniref:Uncharacterized protein n=1 Tax=Gossypium barbadense TaxID=3634 RepID=A0A2P5XHC2_GOSBA|nr:hypothetical protein GOBAR_AA17914 [Gossypium barbadense]